MFQLLRQRAGALFVGIADDIEVVGAQVYPVVASGRGDSGAKQKKPQRQQKPESDWFHRSDSPKFSYIRNPAESIGRLTLISANRLTELNGARDHFTVNGSLMPPASR